jgi:tetratricopeptide (TPR) repeat protein
MYLLAETYLKLGKPDEARKTVAQLDQISADDYRTQTGIGVLLARYRLYDDAIRISRPQLRANPDSDDVKFDLADAYFRKARYRCARRPPRNFSGQGRTMPSWPCSETSRFT